jgi:hypothetical protein
MNSNPIPRKAPGQDAAPAQPAPPRRAPGAPDQPDAIEAPPAPEPATSPDSDGGADAMGVGPEEAHVGATEEQVGDRGGPGVGYDQKRR